MRNADTDLKNIEIPAVPMVALRILRIIDSPTADVKEVQEAILADQSLAARVLRMANSSYYGVRRNIDTVTDAVVTLGFSTLKNLVLAVSTREVYKRFGLLEQKLWEHSIGVSAASAVIAREVGFHQIEEASVAGLLHDVGKVVMNNAHPEKFLALTEMVYNENVTFDMRETTIFGYGHAEVGGLLAQKWGFPKILCEAIRRHHFFRSFNDLSDLDEASATLCCIIVLADALCVRLGIGYRTPMENLPLRDKECIRMLGIRNERAAELTDAVKEAFILERMHYRESE